MPRNTYTMPELANELRMQRALTRDFLADTEKVVALAPDSFSLNGERFGMTNHAHSQLSTTFKIPKAYYDRIRLEMPQLFTSTVNTHFAGVPKRRMFRTLRGDIRAMLGTTFRRIDHVDILESIWDEFEAPGWQPESIGLTETRMYVKMVQRNMQADIRVGDPVQAGVMISNSEVGCGSIDVLPFIKRLICLNGMTVEDGRFKRRHVGKRLQQGDNGGIYSDDTLIADDKALLLKVRDHVRLVSSTENFSKLVDKMRSAAGSETVKNPQETVELISKQHNLREEEKSRFLTNLVNGGDLTKWGVANAVTNLAQHVSDYDRATELEAAGGKIIEIAATDWRTLIKQ